MARHLVQLAKAVAITITEAQLDVLMAGVSMAIARYGYKCPSGFDASEQDAARGINAADLYSLLVDLKQQYGQESQPNHTMRPNSGNRTPMCLWVIRHRRSVKR